METRVRIFLEDAPPMRIRNGIVHILDTGAGFACEHTMAVETLQASIDRGQRLLARYARGERDIYEGG